MAPKKEYRCKAHGDFESRAKSPKCPYGCNTVERVFLTPTMISTGGGRETARVMDALQEQIARDYNLGDMTNRNGEAVIKAPINAAPRDFTAENYMQNLMSGRISGPTFAPNEMFKDMANLAPDTNIPSGFDPSQSDNFVRAPNGSLIPKPTFSYRSSTNDGATLSKLMDSRTE